MPRILLIFLLPCLLLAGCGEDLSVVGTWQGKADLKPEATQRLTKVEQFLAQPVLEFRADGGFTMLPLEGTWKQEGLVVTMIPKTVLGMKVADVKEQLKGSGRNRRLPNGVSAEDLDVPIQAHLSRDKKTIMLKHPLAEKLGSLSFQRQ